MSTEKRRSGLHSDRLPLIQRQPSAGTASLALGDKSINHVYSPFQPSLTVPSEPFLCLAMISSATFFYSVSGL